MKTYSNRYKYISILIVIITLGTTGGAWAKKNDFHKIYIFGDSLSDPGNVYALTGETSKPPYELIPSAPYKSRHHQFTFSNGKTWAQEFTKKMHAKKSGNPILESPKKNGNYAFGGARARPGSASMVPSATDQLGLYFAEHRKADKKALYVIQFGGNDVRDALEVFDPGPMAPSPQEAELIIHSAVVTTLGMINTLYQSGARHFLVVDAPNISHAPAVKLAGPGAAFVAGLLVTAYNNGLDFGLENLKMLPGVSINRLSLYSIINDVVDSPEKFGIKNTASPCLNFYVKSGSKCKKPKTYLFWDGIHPTETIHKLVGKEASKLY
jgi:phospholipase/lecithinase/hemolysin